MTINYRDHTLIYSAPDWVVLDPAGIEVAREPSAVDARRVVDEILDWVPAA